MFETQVAHIFNVAIDFTVELSDIAVVSKFQRRIVCTVTFFCPELGFGKVVHHYTKFLVEQEGSAFHHIHHTLTNGVGGEEGEGEVFIGEGVGDTSLSNGQSRTCIVEVVAIDDAIAVLVFDFATTGAKGMGQRTEGEGYAFSFLTIIIGDLALVLHNSFIVIGVDAVDGTTEDFVVEVFAIIRREEFVPVARDVES